MKKYGHRIFCRFSTQESSGIYTRSYAHHYVEFFVLNESGWSEHLFTIQLQSGGQDLTKGITFAYAMEVTEFKFRAYNSGKIKFLQWLHDSLKNFPSSREREGRSLMKFLKSKKINVLRFSEARVIFDNIETAKEYYKTNKLEVA